MLRRKASKNQDVPMPRKSLSILYVLWAVTCLVTVQVIRKVLGFGMLYSVMIKSRQTEREPQKTDLCVLLHALQIARSIYFMQVKCLDYAAAGTLFFRSCGWSVELVLGVIFSPFIAHAWIEYEGEVITGTAKRDLYVVLDRV
jgi:hypothetical protein